MLIFAYGVRSNIHWIIEKARNSRKTSTSASLTTLKLLTVWIKTTCGKFLKRCDYQTTLHVSWEACMQVKKQQFELEEEQVSSSQLWKECDKAVYCHPISLTDMQSASYKMLGWMKHRLEIKIARRNQQPQICRRHDSNGRKWQGTKEPLEGERGEWKSWLKTQCSKN